MNNSNIISNSDKITYTKTDKNDRIKNVMQSTNKTIKRYLETVGKFSQVLKETPELIDFLNSLPNDFLDEEKIEKYFSFPKPRLIQDKNKREELRKNKKTLIDVPSSNIGNFYDFLMNYENFEKYELCSTWVENTKKSMKEKQEFFLNLESEAFVEFYKKQQGKLVNDIKNYCGFGEITISKAVSILAKLHGFQIRENNTLYIKYSDLIGTTQKEDDINEINLFINDKKSQKTRCEFRANLYPYHTLSEFANDDVIEFINKLDNQDNICLFDYYWIVVPSISVINPLFMTDNGYNVNGKIFDNDLQAQQELDKYLISSGKIYPVILGEKDNINHFICYLRNL